MVLKINTVRKLVELEHQVSLKELNETLKEMFPKDYLDFKISMGVSNSYIPFSSSGTGVVSGNNGLTITSGNAYVNTTKDRVYGETLSQ